MTNIHECVPLKLKRINKELYMLKKRFNFNVIINIDCLDIIIKTNLKKHKCLIHIRLLNDYPFICPCVRLNGIDYKHFLEKASIKHNMTTMCLSCESILCPDNWKPGYKLADIINEIINYSLYYQCFLPVDVYD